jgi:hypothetical protein
MSDLWTRVGFEVSKFRWGQSHWRQYLLWTLIPVLAVMLYQIIVRKPRRFWRRKRSKPLGDGSWPGLDSEFYELEEDLAKRGLGRQPNEPISVWLQRIDGEQAVVQIRRPLSELVSLHYRYRFDPHGLDLKEREHLRERAYACLSSIERGLASVSSESGR